jgi:hypothetical protein
LPRINSVARLATAMAVSQPKFNVPDDFGHIQTIAPAQAFERLLRLKSATGAAADVITPEERPLSAGKNFQRAAHGGLWMEGVAHAPKNFWISPITSTRRSTSARVL